MTNDEGFYVLDDKVAAGKLREVETREERSKLLDIYRAQRRTLKPGRLDIPRRVPPMSGHDLWDSNRPGSTLFLPVCDVSASLISLIAQFVDPALRRYASASGGMNIVDDRHGFRPAGTERWLKDGFLNAEQVLPLSILERQACYYVFSEPAAICQNMFLATEALGLGGWKHCGFLSLEIFERMGFRIVAADGGSGFGNPIGLDGVFEASCPPYYPTMDAAVDAVFSRTPREAHGTSAASHVRRGTSRRHRPCQRRRPRLHEGGLQLHLRHLRPLSRRHRRDASDVGDAGASHRYRLLQPLLRRRRLWPDARGAHGDLASMTPRIGA